MFGDQSNLSVDDDGAQVLVVRDCFHWLAPDDDRVHIVHEVDDEFFGLGHVQLQVVPVAPLNPAAPPRPLCMTSRPPGSDPTMMCRLRT